MCGCVLELDKNLNRDSVIRDINRNDCTSNGDSDIDLLHRLRIQNVCTVIVGNLNVASLPNKIDELRDIVKYRLDLLVLSETHLDSSFPTSQFLIDGFNVPYRQDRNRNGGGILIYVGEDIPSKLLDKHLFPDVVFNSNDTLDPIEGMFLEINLRKSKWLFFGMYHRPTQNDEYYIDKVTHALDLYAQDYQKFLWLGILMLKIPNTVPAHFCIS